MYACLVRDNDRGLDNLNAVKYLIDISEADLIVLHHNLAWTYEMKIEILIDSDELWPRLESDIRLAKHQIYIQTLSFEGDKVGRRLSNLILRKPSCDRKLLIDSYTKFVLSDKFLYAPRNFLKGSVRRERRQTIQMISNLTDNHVEVKFTNKAGPLMLKFARRNHKKLVLIDDTTSYIGGINFSEHNFEWHDVMMRIRDRAIASFFEKDFLATWSGQNLNRGHDIDGMRCYVLDGHSNANAFREIFRMIDAAKQYIFIESPYISFPFYEKLRQARKRKVEITLLAPANNNRRFLDKYTQWEAARSDLDLRLYKGGMTHLKAMLIDDHSLVVGSSNFDYLSYRLYQEIIAIITSADVISSFKEKVIRKDLYNSTKFKGNVGNLNGHFRDLVLKSLADLSIIANKIC